MNSQEINRGRRNFIRQSITSLAGIAILPSAIEIKEETKDRKATEKSKFIYRTLGKTGIKLPIVSMGVACGGGDPTNLVKAALKAGVVYFDTSQFHQRGRNEELLGKAVKGWPRDSIYIATKVFGDHEDQVTGSFSKKTKPDIFLKKFENSLKRLDMDYVDILFLHNVGSKESALFEPLMSALVKLKKEGKTRFIGVSTHVNEPEVINAVTGSKIYDVVLTAYNFRQPHNQKVKKAIADAAKAGVGVIAMKTSAGVYWDKERKHQINMKAALKWVLQNENICTAIPGFTAFDQLNLDMSVMEDLTLTPKEKADLKLGQKLGMPGLYCQQCGKCISQCRECLYIPTLMRSYMYAYGYRNSALAKETLQSVDLPNAPCTDCHTCTVTCSMGFDVRNKILDIVRLKDVSEDFLV